MPGNKLSQRKRTWGIAGKYLSEPESKKLAFYLQSGDKTITISDSIRFISTHRHLNYPSFSVYAMLL